MQVINPNEDKVVLNRNETVALITEIQPNSIQNWSDKTEKFHINNIEKGHKKQIQNLNIDLSEADLTNDLKEKLRKFVDKNRNMFATDLSEIGMTDVHFHEIDTRNNPPVPLHPNSKQKAAFVTHSGIYEWNRMPYGLRNSSIAFSEVMSQILRGLHWKPKNQHEVRQFLGLWNYNRRFVKDYAKITVPLNNLLHKDKEYVWTDKCKISFENLKQALTTAPVLSYPHMSKPFILTCDASGSAIGYILGQLDENGKERVISYSVSF
ncbi:Hypothetical predicted protein [Mytilus galloprovincialis]|uniref:Reverse transcriptase/retrotransposon-derived protein RNase H-like domain-containing protein n=1 Tax=Mytilus galloprovincialis TaxID=29158 RepID=A0A8B6DXA8_MYTGA|nr:Hypothetical predicted protein [Mytilus galloprovincialis]